ncbi:MAG: transglutaminase domain-containing protein, partial [Candidatus Latescibacteria bacterium]|nr:transglutaminase domain-containing protein [Candidatus Latescibacterota bacterium]
MIRIITFIAFSIIIYPAASISQEVDNRFSWQADAETIYETGFMHRLMKHPGGGVSLFNFDLVENDASGAGNSEKGVHKDTVWGKIRARKVLTIDNPRAHRAWLYVFPQRNPKHPLSFQINGNLAQIPNTKLKGWETVRWAEFPAEWLKKGKNVIEIFCPEAKAEEEGWILQLARADEFEEGGGDPANVGKTSFKSTNNGKSWKMSPFGQGGKDRAEYCVRICLERHVDNGWLESPVIDLWKDNSDDLIIRQRTIKKLHVTIQTDIPEGATVNYLLRKGTSPDPFSEEWEEYENVGSGAALDLDIDGEAFNRRYFQFKTVLATQNPLVSPVVKSAQVSAEFKESFPVPRHKNIYILEVDNPSVRYSSLNWEWEECDRPELNLLRKQENLDTVIAGSRTQLEIQMKLLDYAKKRWRWTSPNQEYPEWDALSIVNRINKAGGGGMCIQQNLFFVGLCQAFGMQGRLLGVDGHEVCEVWNDEYGKWIYFDAFF